MSRKDHFIGRSTYSGMANPNLKFCLELNQYMMHEAAHDGQGPALQA